MAKEGSLQGYHKRNRGPQEEMGLWYLDSTFSRKSQPASDWRNRDAQPNCCMSNQPQPWCNIGPRMNGCMKDKQGRKNLLGKYTDHTPTQPLMANTTNSILINSKFSPSATVQRNSFSKKQCSLHLDGRNFSQSHNDHGVFHNTVGIPYAASEIKFKL